MANEYRLFRGRYADLFRDIGRQHPSFWTELGDLVAGHLRRQYTTQGAQVREFPSTRECGVQTERTWSVDQVLNEVFGRNPVELNEANTQTPSPELRNTGMQTLPDCRTMETQTEPPGQRTVGTQVEITTWDLKPGPTRTEATGTPRGRGRGLRPVLPSELRPVGVTDLVSPREAPSLPREAPPPSMPQGRSPGRTTRRSPSAHRPSKRTPERRDRSTVRRASRERSGERGRRPRSPTRGGQGEPAERRADRRSSRSAAPARVATLCWNCRATDHRYSDCPHPRDNPYCYGCGRRGVTMRTCPGCCEEWRNLGPYRREQGHLGNRDLPFP
ncbi:inner centromere [Lasius niger]|uniref:Inner centromere n=1 Tax=Lasius niger TaxID=67767 RepID=A0A0J7K2V1_LASNI|nr:inner centromere [Lasius niger]